MSLVMSSNHTQVLAAMHRSTFRQAVATSVMEAVSEPILTIDLEGAVLLLNARAERLLGLSDAQARGRALFEVMRIERTDGTPASDLIERVGRAEASLSIDEELSVVSGSGWRAPVHIVAAPVRDAIGVRIASVLVLRDLTEVRQLERHVSYQAEHDALTGLPIRSAFEAEIERLLIERDSANRGALLFVDLNNFRSINETAGVAAGDRILRAVADLLEAHLGERVALARLGADQFGVLLGHADTDAALLAAEGVVEILRRFFETWGNQSGSVGASVGVYTLSDDCEVPGVALARAEAACQAAKALGRNRVRLFRAHDEDVHRAQTEMQWAACVSAAWRKRSFSLQLQEIRPVGAHGAEPVHYEVLLRLNDEALGSVEPADFIPVAERHGLLPEIDRWVIGSVLGHLSTRELLDAAGRPRAIYSINLSGATLNDPSLADFVAAELQRHGVPARVVCFEITETSAIANLVRAGRLTHQLRELGCRVALDDFGIGLSSFAYLRSLSLDYLKIDGTFVRELASNGTDRAIVAAINAVGHEMGLKTVAEFVESELTLRELERIGVDFVQGYGIGRPGAMA